MTYCKPEISVLGSAVRVIENVNKTVGSETNGGPAYDLDE
jgi:hypothetical protein